MKVMTISEIAATERVGRGLSPARDQWDRTGGTFVSLSVLLSISGAVNGCILTGGTHPIRAGSGRLVLRRDLAPCIRDFRHRLRHLWSGLWTAVLIVSGSYETLYSYSILAAWIFYTMSVLAVYILRRKMRDTPRPYRMWGYPYTLWAFIVISVWFIVNALVTQPRPSLMALVIVATGVAAYRIWRKPSSLQ